jgi:hypothetical protein
MVFSRDKCAHKGTEGPAANPTSQAGATTFKCADFASAEQAGALAALINAGARPQRNGHAAPDAVRSKSR